MFYIPNLRNDNPKVKERLYIYMKILARDVIERKNITLQLRTSNVL